MEMVVIAIAAIAVIAVTTIIILFINLYPSLGSLQLRGSVDPFPV